MVGLVYYTVNEQVDEIICMILLQIELTGIGSYGTALYCGTGCFHRREALCGKKYSEDFNGSVHLDAQSNKEDPKTINELEEACKLLVDCNFENGSQWGKEVSLSLSLSLYIYIYIYTHMHWRWD